MSGRPRSYVADIILVSSLCEIDVWASKVVQMAGTPPARGRSWRKGPVVAPEEIGLWASSAAPFRLISPKRGIQETHTPNPTHYPTKHPPPSLLLTVETYPLKPLILLLDHLIPP